MNDAAVTPLKFPAPWPGGKSKVADVVWERFGDVDNYVEAFAGTAAVLLRRPAEHFASGYRVETINDANSYVVNFFRAVTADPEAVARWADNPVHEADLHARHRWLVRSDESAAWKMMMACNPDYFDAKIAGWWVWGQCCWIGSGWCDGSRESSQIPDFDGGRGVLGELTTAGRPQLADAFDIGRGVNGGGSLSTKRPDIGGGGPDAGQRSGRGVVGNAGLRRPVCNTGAGALGYGVNAGEPSLQIPKMSCGKRTETTGYMGQGVNATPLAVAGTCDARRSWLTAWMRRLADRLRLVRSCYGHWARVCDSDSTLTRLGSTGVFLDSPYSLSVARMHEWVRHLRGDGPLPGVRKGKAERADKLYATDKGSDVDRLVAEVHLWCHKWGADPNIRVCVAGYEGEHNPLEELGWEKFEWAASGGYGNQGKQGGKAENAMRERLWFNPSCLKPVAESDLFAGL